MCFPIIINLNYKRVNRIILIINDSTSRKGIFILSFLELREIRDMHELITVICKII